VNCQFAVIPSVGALQDGVVILLSGRAAQASGGEEPRPFHSLNGCRFGQWDNIPDWDNLTAPGNHIEDDLEKPEVVRRETLEELEESF
jgi:hypothetical protein